MTASAWIAFAALGVCVIAHMVGAAYFFGKQSQRLATVEKEVGERSSVNDSVVELKVEMVHVKEQMTKYGNVLEGIQRQLGNIAMNRVGLSGELP